MDTPYQSSANTYDRYGLKRLISVQTSQRAVCTDKATFHALKLDEKLAVLLARVR